MPINYKNGKIYALRSYQINKIYIGSTCSNLSQRKAGHKNDYKRFIEKKDKNWLSSFYICEYDDCYIELLETKEFKNKEEMLKLEGQYIRDTENCINKQITGRTQKEYQNENKEYIKNLKKEYNNKNKEYIVNFRNTKFKCSCNKLYSRYNKKRHLKSKFHDKHKNNI